MNQLQNTNFKSQWIENNYFHNKPSLTCKEFDEKAIYYFKLKQNQSGW